MPQLREYVQAGYLASIRPALPAVTCTAQATYLTGLNPSQHGIVGNGWYDRDLAEVHFWKQSNHLVHGQKLWEELRDLNSGYTCAKLFWWYNMYSSVNYSITPRPMYPADGRKVFDIYTAPLSIRTEIKRDLGEFPFRTFWGPGAGIPSSQWIADSARWVEEKFRPDLSLVYLPHLDYNLQRLGTDDPAIAQDITSIEEIVSDLVGFFAERDVQAVILSEYGISNVDRPIHLNRRFRKQGLVTIKKELGLEMLDCGASKAFALADHQVAHIYISDPSAVHTVRRLVEKEPGITHVMDRQEAEALGLNHPRSGDLIAFADARSWFTYYYWLDDALAPDFARTVDIHRKTGYDPVELFIDPAIRFPAARVGIFLLKKKLGLRTLLKLVPLDGTLVKGSHGRMPENSDYWPVLLIPKRVEAFQPEIEATEVYGILKQVCLPEY